MTGTIVKSSAFWWSVFISPGFSPGLFSIDVFGFKGFTGWLGSVGTTSTFGGLAVGIPGTGLSKVFPLASHLL